MDPKPRPATARFDGILAARRALINPAPKVEELKPGWTQHMSLEELAAELRKPGHVNAPKS